MSEQNNNQIISIIDIGTTKIIALIADYNIEESKINKIIGFGESESNGLKSGVVVNINVFTLNTKGYRIILTI